ncbi:MAG: hypothetical protein AB8G22_11365, partial [Saprospiraceae bacterium]
MKYQLLFYIFITQILSISTVFGQSSITKTYPVSDLQRDVKILQEQLEKIHPGLNTYTTPAEYETFFKELAAGIAQPLTQVEIYRQAMPLHNLIRSGHTLIIPPEKRRQAV